MFDFDHAVSVPFRMQPGLRRLAPGTPQLSPQRPGDAHVQAKLAVLAQHPAQALCVEPGFDATPALNALAQHAAAEQPQAWAVQADGRWLAHHLGWAVDEAGELTAQPGGCPRVGQTLQALAATWRRAGLLALAFAEDFAVVDAASTRLPWLAVALPSHWAPQTKVGRSFAEVHAPVADNALLVKAAPALTRLVCGEERWERFVWTVTRHPGLAAHPAQLNPAPWPAEADPAALAAMAWWRTERQTFIPLPAHGQAVFTILVHSQPLPQALHSPAQAQRLHDSLASMGEAVLAYRSLGEARDRLLAWLAQQAQP